MRVYVSWPGSNTLAVCGEKNSHNRNNNIEIWWKESDLIHIMSETRKWLAWLSHNLWIICMNMVWMQVTRFMLKCRLYTHCIHCLPFAVIITCGLQFESIRYAAAAAALDQCCLHFFLSLHLLRIFLLAFFDLFDQKTHLYWIACEWVNEWMNEWNVAFSNAYIASISGKTTSNFMQPITSHVDWLTENICGKNW